MLNRHYTTSDTIQDNNCQQLVDVHPGPNQLYNLESTTSQFS